ncbi:unnamed protein product, partial [Durusdinium trenchii]
VTSRSMGRLSATQSEIYREIFNDAAVSLVTDIFAESVTQADEETKRKANHVAVQRVTADVIDQLLGPHAVGGSEISDHMEWQEQLEDLVLLSFDSLDHQTLDHSIFVQELLTVFRGLGLAERHANSLQIQITGPSVLAEILGPSSARAPVEQLPIHLVEVMGCYAQKVPSAPPRWKPEKI